MQLIETLHIQIELLEGGRVFIYGTDEGEPVPAELWATSFFLWDADSFFGTKLDIQTLDGKSGVLMSAHKWMKVLAEEPFNSFINWSWSNWASISLALAQSLYETVENGTVMPDFNDRNQDGITFPLPQEILEDFQDSFWEQEMARHEHDGIQTITVRRFAEEWLNEAIKDRPGNHRVGDLLDLFAEKNISTKVLSRFFDGDRWEIWTGAKEDELPFSMGMRLSEPDFAAGDEVDQWKLEPFMRGKRNEEQFFIWADRHRIPFAWKRHLEMAEKEIARWKDIFPWIDDIVTEDQAWDFLTDASEVLHMLGVEILLPSWWQAIKDAKIAMKAKVKNSPSRRKSFVGMNALLDYNWRFSVNGAEVSEEEFNKLVEEKRKLVYIRGRWVKLDPALMRRMQELKKEADERGLRINDLLQQEFAQDEELEDENEGDYARIQFELNSDLRRFMTRINSLQDIPTVQVPDAFQGELRPYQQQGMSWLMFLREYGFGACLADDMGLGKTIQLISYLLAVEAKNGPAKSPSLIVCPTSVLGNWQKEFEKFAPSMNVHLHYGPSRMKGEQFRDGFGNADVILTTFGLLHQDEEDFLSMQWNAVVLDEAQNIKNSHTKQSRSARKLEGIHHIALTGTPMENRLSELWSIFDFINKGYLGSLTQFDKNFAGPIERNGDKNKIATLQRLIQPFLLRRTKKDEEVALNLPDKLEQKEFISLTTEQAALYEQLVKDTLDQVEKLSGFERKGLILQMLTKLKQICNHPALYLKEEAPKHILHRSGKMEKLIELLDIIYEQDESVLIFTQYIEMGNMIKQIAERRYGHVVPFLNGSANKKQRDTMVADFQDGKYPILLLSLKAGGTGLNLTAANHVIHYDRWWNPAVENQATDRAYRIGQTRFVHVHKMVSSGTLEEKIDVMLEKKQSLNDEIVQSDNWITELSSDELKDLLVLER
ncbi:DEAD/DEAH box helicase [Pradoshia sp. D12]|uniref:DEAD/DEAH box helicase n=1 Tax=Bacillaceae TaxID=186817 RepID=UPI00080AE7D0|nr:MULTISPECIES: DEAD/DEAH box helicase [Bacillaceae]OCA84583.1 ATP-dependent helicase [Bacillus sp. FJAT-27986]QFK72947.1 DEAD/DEAH box helicase [Pradoshia sp. D12]TPF71939.1 DEAD/DEAH box helicase [Bacillus sp. D12]